MCDCVCLSVCVGVPTEDRKDLRPLELEFFSGNELPQWKLEIKAEAPGRAVSALSR